MLSDIYYRKKLGIPFLSLIFIGCCLLVTIPTYFFPELYKVLGGSQQKYYIWQYLTLIFEHGSYNVPILLHLLINVIVIGFFGVITERILGTKKFFILNISSGIVFYITLFYMNGLYGNGASGVIWAYTSITFFSIIYLYKRDKYRLIRDISFYICILLLIITWIIITVVDYRIHGRISYGIISHFISVTVGFIFVFIWKDYIRKRINNFSKDSYKEKTTNSMVNKGIKKIALTVPTFIIIVLILTFSGILTNHISTVEIVNISPINSIETLNKENQQIIIKFNQPMKRECKRSSLYSTSEIEHSEKIRMDIRWIDNQTLMIKLNRKVYEDEKIKIVLDGLTDLKGRDLKENIILKFGYEY